jgi:transposase
MIAICADRRTIRGRADPGTPAVPCRGCPGGISRSTRRPRYPSDMGDAEWAVTEPALPAPAWKQGKGGRPAQRCRRDIVDAIRYLVKEGIQWRAMPCDFPPYQRVYDTLNGWQESGATEAMHGELRAACRIAAGRSPEPTAAIIDSRQSGPPRPSPSPAVASTRARKSAAASDTSPSMRAACCSPCWSPRQW